MDITEIEQDQADAVIAGLTGGAMALCPRCGKKTLSISVYREDQEHPDEVYQCKCGEMFEVFMPEGIVRRDQAPMRNLIPVTKEGNQERWMSSGRTGWRERPKFDFEDTLTYLDTLETRRTFYFSFRRKSTGTTVTAARSEFKSMIPQMVYGEITGKFTFRKRGHSCSVTLAKEKKPRASRTYQRRFVATKLKP